MDGWQGIVYSPIKYRETEGIKVYRNTVLEPGPHSGNRGKGAASVKKSMRQRWLESFGSDKKVWELSKNGENAMYLTRDKPNGNLYGRAPTFHVWKGNMRCCSGPDAQTADKVYAQTVEGSR